MLTTNVRRARRVAGWAGVVCAALLATACNSNGPASGPITGPTPPPSTAPATAPATGPTANSTFLAQGQDINGTVLHMPTCATGCVLSGDSTAILDKMTWNTWSGEAVGTGTYENGPQKPWVFSSVVTAAQQSCARRLPDPRSP
jgi:hypothetical protein